MNEYEFRGLTIRTDTLDQYVVGETANYKDFTRRIAGLFVWDVGANIGAMSRTLLDAGASRVVSFEPEPDNVRLLRRNAPEATIIPAAMVDHHEETTRFYISSGKNKGGHSTVEMRGRSYLDVPSVNVETMLEQYSPEAVKCDTEGGEYAILARIAQWPTVQYIAAEIHLNRKEWRNVSAPNLFSQIEAAGFQPIKEPKVTAKNWHTLAVWARV